LTNPVGILSVAAVTKVVFLYLDLCTLYTVIKVVGYEYPDIPSRDKWILWYPGFNFVLWQPLGWWNISISTPPA